MIIDDLRDVGRGLARGKALTAVLLVSLALGTGMNAAVYGVADALLFRGPAGVVDPSRLIDLYTSQLNGLPYGRFSYPDYLSLTQANTSSTSIVATHDALETVRVGLSAQRVRVASVSEGFFAALCRTKRIARFSNRRGCDSRWRPSQRPHWLG